MKKCGAEKVEAGTLHVCGLPINENGPGQRHVHVCFIPMKRLPMDEDGVCHHSWYEFKLDATEPIRTGASDMPGRP